MIKLLLFTMTLFTQGYAATVACEQRAVSLLKANSANGYRTWQRLSDKSVFNAFLTDCGNANDFLEIDLPTSVHESNHAIRSDTGDYHLVSDEMLPVPPAAKYYAPKLMAKAMLAQLRVPKDDDYYTTYVAPTASASSKDDFTYLLDELNAYSNDQQVSVDLANQKVYPLNNRQGGVPALLAFVAYYVNYAQAQQPTTWNQLTTNATTRSALVKLWNQGERVLVEACHLQSSSPTDDSYYIRSLCNPKQTAALAQVLGQAVRCPSECQ